MNTEQKGAPAEAPGTIVHKHMNIQGQAEPLPQWRQVRHPLKFPIERNGAEPLREILLREPDVEALERIDALGLVEGQALKVAQISGMISALSGQPIETIRRMHKDDFAAIGEASVPLLEGAPGK